MHLGNPISKARADALYVSSAFTRTDGWDNATDYVVLGIAASYQGLIVEYGVVLPVSSRVQTGTITITHNGVSAEIIDHLYQHSTPEIETLTFGADISGGAVRLIFTKAGVGENPSLFTRTTMIQVA